MKFDPGANKNRDLENKYLEGQEAQRQTQTEEVVTKPTGGSLVQSLEEYKENPGDMTFSDGYAKQETLKTLDSLESIPLPQAVKDALHKLVFKGHMDIDYDNITTKDLKKILKRKKMTFETQPDGIYININHNPNIRGILLSYKNNEGKIDANVSILILSTIDLIDYLPKNIGNSVDNENFTEAIATYTNTIDENIKLLSSEYYISFENAGMYSTINSSSEGIVISIGGEHIVDFCGIKGHLNGIILSKDGRIRLVVIGNLNTNYINKNMFYKIDTDLLKPQKEYKFTLDFNDKKRSLRN